MDFQQVYKNNYEQIFRFCYRFTGDHELSKDITQDVFMKLYSLHAQNHIPENVNAWLYKVAGNTCINRACEKRRKDKIIEALNKPVIEKSNPESIFIHDEDRALIRNAINKIKMQNRLLILMYQDGLSYKAMSEATGIPLSSIGKTLWRSIEKISTIITNMENEK